MTQLKEGRTQQIASLRQEAREVVRELGMLENCFPVGSLSNSQCHALLELERAGSLRVGDLAELLRLDKSVVSRIVRDLVERRLVSSRTPREDRRQRQLTLSAAGRRLAARVNETADARVAEALEQLSTDERDTVLQGMGLYARGLRRARVQTRVKIRALRPADDPAVADIIHTVMTEHGARGPGFAISDPEVTRMSEYYLPDATPPGEYFVLDDDGQVIGGAGFAHLEGGAAHTCELRKMYLLPRARGAGLGRLLLTRVLEAAHAAGYRRCYLETMATMQRARALYRSFGFEPLSAPEGSTGHFGCDAWYARKLPLSGERGGGRRA